MIQLHHILKVLLWPALAFRSKLRAHKEVCFEACYKELLRHVEEGSVVVHVPDFGGSFEIDIRSSLLKRILKRGCYEPDLVRVVREHVDPRRDAIDIGANVGFFTILFARMLRPGRRILAVEPAPSALKFLHRNIQRNKVSDIVTIYEGAITDRTGDFSLHLIPGKEEYSSVFPIVHPSVTDAATIVAQIQGNTLDHLIEQMGFEPGFIKIDTEGAEYLVLRGAMKTLTRWRPVVLCEVSDVLLSRCGASSSDVTRLLEDLGYTVLNAARSSQPIVSPFVGELLAVPKKTRETD